MAHQGIKVGKLVYTGRTGPGGVQSAVKTAEIIEDDKLNPPNINCFLLSRTKLENMGSFLPG